MRLEREREAPLPHVETMTEHQVRAELQWWRHFIAKFDRDSDLPRIGSPIYGRIYSLRETDR